LLDEYPYKYNNAEHPLSKELNKIFSPTCTKVQRIIETQLRLVDTQLKSDTPGRKKTSAVLLTGEFGESVYLFEFLEAKLKGVKLLRVDK
jgi:hypothetical protein